MVRQKSARMPASPDRQARRSCATWEAGVVEARDAVPPRSRHVSVAHIPTDIIARPRLLPGSLSDMRLLLAGRGSRGTLHMHYEDDVAEMERWLRTITSDAESRRKSMPLFRQAISSYAFGESYLAQRVCHRRYPDPTNPLPTNAPPAAAGAGYPGRGPWRCSCRGWVARGPRRASSLPARLVTQPRRL